MTLLARRASLLSFGTLLLPAIAFAQAIPTPGAIQDQLRKPITAPPAAISSPLPPAVVPAPAVPAGGRKVKIIRFEFNGASAIPADELHQVVAGDEGKELSLLEIYEVSDKVTHYYRTRGYALATAFVPEQKIASGVVRLEIIEGKLGKTLIEGNKHYRPGFLAWQLGEIKPGEVVRSAALEHQMLLLNDLPGLAARAVMQPGDDYGTSNLVVQTQEKNYEGGLQLNNHGRESIGEWRVQADAALNGLLGVGDRFDFTGLYAEGNLLHYGRMAYSMPVTPRGTRANVYYSRFGYRVDTGLLGGNLSTLDIEGEGENYGVNFLHPVLRSPNKSLFMGAGFDRTYSTQNELTNGDVTNAHLGVAQFTALFNYQAADQSLSTAGALLSTNFQGSPLVKNAAGGFVAQNNTEAAKVQLDFSHYRYLWQKLALFARFTAAMSADPLVDLDQFRIGGPNSVRAYPASEVGGDEGYFMSAELQYPVMALPGIADQKVKAFIDSGTVFRTQSTLRGLRSSDDLTGAGIGYSALVLGHLSIDVMMAHPIGQYEASDRDQGMRFWTSFNAQF